MAAPDPIHIPSRRCSLPARPSIRRHSISSTPLLSFTDAGVKLRASVPRSSSDCLPFKNPARESNSQDQDPLAKALHSSRSFAARYFSHLSDMPAVIQRRKASSDTICSSLTLASSCAKTAGVKRWDGSGKRSEPWDGLRRDSELWFSHGDCFVHLYAKGQSRRGPSFCVPMSELQRAKCGNLFTLCFAQKVPKEDVPLGQLAALESPPDSMYELYMPAPEDTTKEEAFEWHMANRNFFAFIFRKPLVGSHLGTALINLQERLHLFRTPGSSSNHEALMTYAKDMGYMTFTDRPDNALAMIFYAEHYQLKILWIDAYAHCVGMNDTLYLSSEHRIIPRVTKALITRAYLEMDLHLNRVAKALSNFLEEELSPQYLGVPSGPRAHLERFRTFLHDFYVQKYGYWPPPKTTNYPRALYRAMYQDFRGLHDLLVDMHSSASIQYQRPADGGICVLQNVQAFDRRHKYSALPHPLPLLPTTPPPNSLQTSKSLGTFKISNKQSKLDKQRVNQASLLSATNGVTGATADSPLVKAYKRFERDYSDKQKEKVSLSDARKVRWILIYATLQMLMSVTRAPPEVTDTDAMYPLCCLTAGTPPWNTGKSTAPESSRENDSGYASAELEILSPEASVSAYSIKPDCEGYDYITHTSPSNTNFKRRPSASPSVEVPAPLRVNSSASPTAGRRSSLPPLHRSNTSSWRSPFSKRNSVRVPPQPYCEIHVPGYGNGLNETIIDPPAPTTKIPTLSANSFPVRESIRRVPPEKLTLKTSFQRGSVSAPLSAYAPATEPIAETDEPKRTPTLDCNQFDFASTPLTLLPASTSALSLPAPATCALAGTPGVPYFHTRCASHGSGLPRAAAAQSAVSSVCSIGSGTCSPADSVSSGANTHLSLESSAASSATSLCVSEMLCSSADVTTSDCTQATDATTFALAATEKLMAELSLDTTAVPTTPPMGTISRTASTKVPASLAPSRISRTPSMVVSKFAHLPHLLQPNNRSSSIYECSISSSVLDTPVQSRPGTALGREAIDLGDRGVVTMYQDLVGRMSPTVEECEASLEVGQ
ncbi:hypothetical protein IWX47DRAFT_854568 [Phyllosticta citricarpa]